ncbi:unnamed protein product [Cunninghamella blakesleeana]
MPTKTTNFNIKDIFLFKKKSNQKAKVEIKVTANYLINKLHLEPHSEGGSYSEVYRDKLKIKKEGLPPNEFNDDRSCSTNKVSSFHTLKSDELWHFYEGNTSITIYEITLNGDLKIHQLGKDLENGESYVCSIEKHSWFAAELNEKTDDSFVLIGCTVAPGFEYQDYTLGTFDDLKNVFPQHVELIRRLTP